MPEEKSKSPKVVVYTSPTCPWCVRVEEFLAEHNIAFEKKDISNPSNAEEAVSKSEQIGVPVIDIDGEIIVGFDEQRIREKLQLV